MWAYITLVVLHLVGLRPLLPPPTNTRPPSARTLETWRHARRWTCQWAQEEDDEDEEGAVLLETINSCRPTFPPTFDTSHVVWRSLPPLTYARRLRGETATGPRKNVDEDATKNSDLLHSLVSEAACDEMEKRHLYTRHDSRTKSEHLLLHLRKKIR